MIQPIGYLRLYRELFLKPIWLNSTPEQKTILITILAMAGFKDNEWEWKGKNYKTKKGQFVTSATSIMKACGKGITRQNVRAALKRFAKFEFLTYETTKTGMLITIINWALYQDNSKKPNQHTNQDPTKAQPRPNQDPTTIEEGNEYKKYKKETYRDYTQNENLINALIDFEDMRTKIKKPMTDRANQLLLNKLDKLFTNDEEKISALEQSIFNNWQSVYEPKEKAKKKSRKVVDF